MAPVHAGMEHGTGPHSTSHGSGAGTVHRPGHGRGTVAPAEGSAGPSTRSTGQGRIDRSPEEYGRGKKYNGKDTSCHLGMLAKGGLEFLHVCE